ncbi:MAG: folD [Mucilaginibacter sp.]|nr:folD [Mucilaginibacter sp.]
MTAKLIDGKAIAKRLRTDVAERVRMLVEGGGPQPGLAVVLVGDDPASQIYVATKIKQTHSVGMASYEYRLPAAIGESELLHLLDRLNHDDTVHGILVQLPLPPHIDVAAVLEKIDPCKDVDGFNPLNVGRLAVGGQGLVPCTPLGCMMLLKTVHADLAGMDAVMVGGSNIVGRPMARLLLAEEATVTVAHLRTRDVQGLCRSADIIVVAAGSPGLIRGSWVKPGATVIDVGINRLPSYEGKAALLVGDVAFNEVVQVAGAITPVPGGVGPMTIAFLLSNTFQASKISFQQKT